MVAATFVVWGAGIAFALSLAAAAKRGDRISTTQIGTVVDMRSINAAIEYILQLLRAISPADPSLTIKERNRAIRARYAAGESQTELAHVFGLSPQRVHQVVQGK